MKAFRIIALACGLMLIAIMFSSIAMVSGQSNEFMFQEPRDEEETEENQNGSQGTEVSEDTSSEEKMGDEWRFQERREYKEPPKDAQRTLHIEREKHLVSVNSKMRSADTPLYFDFSIHAREGLSVRASFDGMSDKGGNMTTIMIDFSGLVEYYDIDEDGVYTADKDKLVSDYPLSGSFYDSDFMRGEGDFVNVTWDEEPTHHVDDFGEMDYIDGYNTGFDKGFYFGYEFGVEDFKLNKTFDPDIYAHYSEEDIADMLGLPDVDEEEEEWVEEEEKEELSKEEENEDWPEEKEEDDWEEDDWDEEAYLREKMAWWDYGFFLGFLDGYEMGYEKGYEVMKMMDEDKNQTRGTRYQEPPPPPPPEDEKNDEEEREENFNPKYDEFKKYSDEGYYEPVDFQFVRYKPISIERKDLEGDIQTVVLKVQDLKGVFSLVCKISNDFTKQENGYVSPFAIKIDIHINDYPFVEKETKLALLTDVGITTEGHGQLKMEAKDTSYDEERDLADNEEEVLIEGRGFSGFFSWVKYATCDGVNKTVKVSTTSSFYGDKWDEHGYYSENFRGLTFNYPRAKKIVHDPKIGFIQVDGIDLYEGLGALGDAAERILNGNIWMYAVTAVIAIAFVLVTRKVRKKYY